MENIEKTDYLNGLVDPKPSDLRWVLILLIVAFLIVIVYFVSTMLANGISTKAASGTNQTWDAFQISPVNDPSNTSMVYLRLLSNGECGYLMNGKYVFELPYNFTVDKSFIAQDSWLPEGISIEGYPLLVVVDAKSPTLFCGVGIKIGNVIYDAGPYIHNGTMLIA